MCFLISASLAGLRRLKRIRWAPDLTLMRPEQPLGDPAGNRPSSYGPIWPRHAPGVSEEASHGPPMSPATLATCSPSVAQLDLFFAEQSMPVEAAGIRREDVEGLNSSCSAGRRSVPGHRRGRHAAVAGYQGEAWLRDKSGESGTA